MHLHNIMYAQSSNNKRILFAAALTLALIVGARSAHAQASNTYPSSCPNGQATCEGTVLCIGGKLNSGPNQGQDCTAAPVASGGLARDGVFGCSASKYQNIGSLSAIQGVYVPVNDAAVTLNTGYLVYKECVLDGVVSAIKNDVASGLQRAAINAIETSRNGRPQYLTNFEQDLRPYLDAVTIDLVTGGRSGTMCAAFKNTVPTAVARNYYAMTRDAGKIEVQCPFTGGDAERAAMIAGTQPVNWNTFMKLVEPTGYLVGAYNLEKNRVDTAVVEYEYNLREQIGWSGGFFPAFDNAANPLNQRTLTPGSVIANSFQRMLGVGTDILVQADEIDKINGSLQAGLQTSIIADTIRGLTGFSRSQNGQPSYLDRMSAESSSAVRSGAVNAALGILAAARQVETTYKSAKEGVANVLTDAIGKLRQAENTCWGLIVPKVRDRAASQGVSLRIATTTEFSQKIIDEQIQPLATVTVRDLRASESALNLINQLIASVTNTSSAAAQRAALERLDSMVANNQMHSASEASTAQKQKDEVTVAIGTLVDETLKGWGDSQDTEVGWCNVNNDAVIEMWLDRWRN